MMPWLIRLSCRFVVLAGLVAMLSSCGTAPVGPNAFGPP